MPYLIFSAPNGSLLPASVRFTGKERQRYAKYVDHLGGIQYKGGNVFKQSDHGGDDKTGGCGQIVEESGDPYGSRRKPEFLLRLPEGRVHSRPIRFFPHATRE
jgi:hypothetical protein